MTERIIAWLKKRTWQDWAFLAVLVFVGSYYVSSFGAFQHLPGPIYGGDTYYHFGHMLHIYEFKSPFASSHYAGEYEHYPWLSHLLQAIFARVSGMEPLQAQIWFAPIVGIAGMVVMFLFGQRLFRSKLLGLLTALLWGTVQRIPSSNPTAFAVSIMTPLMLMAVWFARTRRQTLLAGLVYGLAGLTHSVTFLGGAAFIGVVAIWRVAKGRGKGIAWRFAIMKQLRWIGLMALVAVPIALLYWGPPILAYHGHTPNNWQEYTGRGISVSAISSWLIDETWKIFWPATTGSPSGVFGWIFSILPHPAIWLNLLAIIGFILCVLHWRKHLLPLFVMLTGVLGIIHPWITWPLFGISFGYYRFSIFFFVARALFIISGVALFYRAVRQPAAKWGVVVLSVLIMTASVSATFNAYDNDRWARFGREMGGSARAMLDVGDYARQHLPRNAVIIASHGESAFAINALSGVNVQHMRITHASPFVDADARIADAAIIFYGNDSRKRNELLRKYGVTHLYRDSYAAQSQDRCIANWKTLQGDSSYDCLRVRNLSLKPYLERYGLVTKKVHARLDVASSLAPTFDLLAIKPVSRELRVQPLFPLKPGTYPAQLLKLLPDEQ